jgi:hypothetical protein
MCNVFCWKLEWKTEVVKPSIEGQHSASIAQVNLLQVQYVLAPLHVETQFWAIGKSLSGDVVQGDVVLFEQKVYHS